MIALVGVFAGTCVAALLLCHRFVAPISRRSAIVLGLLPLLLTGRAMLTGSYYGPLAISYAAVPLHERSANVRAPAAASRLSDVQLLNVPWLKAVRESVKHGRMPYLNRFMLAGDSLLGTFQPMVFHPATFIGFLLPLARAWTFACSLHFLFAALFAFLFFREIGVEEIGALFGAAGWMLSNFLVFWVGWDIAPAFAPFPLLLLGVRRLARGERGGVAAVTAALTLALLAGHPETVLHETAAAGIWFLFELRRADRPGRSILRAAAAGALAIGLSAPALFPFVETLPQAFESVSRRVMFAHEKKSVSWEETGAAALLAIDPDLRGSRWDAFGESRTRSQEGVYSGAGAFVLALAAAGLFSRRRERWILAGIGALAFATALGMPGVADAIGHLPLFDIALNGRLAGIAAFCTIGLAVFGVEELGRSARGRVVIALIAAATVRIAVGIGMRSPEVRIDRAIVGAALAVVPVLILGVIVGRPTWRRRAVPAAVALLLPFRLADLPPLYPTYSASLFYPPLPEFSSLPKDEDPYRVVGFGYSLPPDESALWELEDPRGYTSMTNARYLHLYPLWCVPQPVSYNRVDDATRPLLSLLNVRFGIGGPRENAPPGWREFRRGTNCAIFENSAALPRAFAPARIWFHRGAVFDDPLEEMGKVKDFRAIGFVENDALAGRQIENGPATVTTRRDGFDLALDVDAKAAAWIIVSQTFWKGWRAELDGVDVPMTFGDYAFLAVRAPAGQHRIRLRYRPRSFTIGVFACLLAIVAATVAGRRRPAR